MKSNKCCKGVILLSICFLLLIGCTKTKETSTVPSADPVEDVQTEDDLYAASMEDAMIADADEIEPVIAITKNSNDVIWSEDEKQVLMLTYHCYPESYEEGKDVTLEWGQVWVTSIAEMVDWYNENKDGVEDWALRFNQLLGLPSDSSYTHISAIWVNPDDMFRPAYVSDITDTSMQYHFDDKVDDAYKKWFDDNIIFSYYDDAYPWTRLGYTYDWFNNGIDKGLSEFVVDADSKINVEFTKNVDDFVAWLDSLDENWESELK